MQLAGEWGTVSRGSSQLTTLRTRRDLAPAPRLRIAVHDSMIFLPAHRPLHTVAAHDLRRTRRDPAPAPRLRVAVHDIIILPAYRPFLSFRGSPAARSRQRTRTMPSFSSSFSASSANTSCANYRLPTSPSAARFQLRWMPGILAADEPKQCPPGLHTPLNQCSACNHQ